VSADSETIRSPSHPLLKRVRAAAAGRAQGEILLEGDRLVDEARLAGLRLDVCLVDELRGDRLAELRRLGVEVRAVRAGLLEGVGQLRSSPGCLALAAEPRAGGLEVLPTDPGALVVVAAGVQDPGNLGALARTAEAAGAAALCVLEGGCSPWNPKVLRGSMGSVLRLPTLRLGAEAALGELEQRGFRQVRALTRGGEAHDAFDWSGRVALWLAAETGELPPELDSAMRRFSGVSISMAGQAESLNVTAAAAVLLFAAGRTRGRSGGA